MSYSEFYNASSICLVYKKIFCYIEYVLYSFEKIKIAFEQYQLIDFKQYWPIFNYLKFHIISHFVHYIWDCGSAINYNTAHNKAAHNHLFKPFYNKINKKEYKPQIW